MDKVIMAPYFIWGAGGQSEILNKEYSNQLAQINILGYIDNNPAKEGKCYYGKIVYSPDILNQNRNAYILVADKYMQKVTLQIKTDYPWYTDRIVNYYTFFEGYKLIVRYGNSTNTEIVKTIDYLKYHPLYYFNYPYIEKYKKDSDQIEYDAERKLFFVMFQGKKMYFSRSFQNEQEVREYYYLLKTEQDLASPHRYLTKDFDVLPGSVVVDVGAAEGNFALEVIDRVKKIYLFEPDDMWVEALRYTFEEYKDKVIIINKFVSNFNDGQTVTIDKILKNVKIDFLKMDIEGEEYYALQGAEKVIDASLNLRCLICTYHQEFAYQAIKQLFSEKGFSVQTSSGYMWYPMTEMPMRLPVLRRGLIRVEKI